MFKLLHIFKRFLSNQIVVLPCILVARYNHMLLSSQSTDVEHSLIARSLTHIKARHRRYKRLKLGGGQVYDRPSRQRL
jgi:hypothetical protein